MSPAYAGRTGSRTQTLLFGGINSEASIANIRDGEAQDITNWDLLPGGAIQVRNGFVNYQALGGIGRFIDHYVKYDGTTIYLTVSGTKIYEATDPSSTWTDVTGTLSLIDSDNSWIGTNFGDNYYLANADNQPLFIQQGFTAQTLKSVSQLQPPTSLAVSAQGATGTTTYQYAVTTVSGRGETTPSYISLTNGNATLSSSNYNLLTWATQLGDSGGYNIYRYDTVATAYKLIGVALPQSGSFQDTGQAYTLPVQNPPSSNTAYNTPADWDSNGYPAGFGVLSRGSGGRLIAFRDNTVWVSGLNNPLDWYGSGAFSFLIDGGQDNRVTAVFPLYDFTVITTRTNSFFVTGNSSTNLTIAKIQGTGCTSPHSAVQVGNDVYVWSQYGPTTLQRILQGADVEYSPIAEKIKTLIRTTSNIPYWKNIVAYNDALNRRIIWLYPSSSSTTNTGAFVFYYTTGGWTKYANYNFAGATVSPDNTQIWGLSTTGTITQLNSGTTDAGAAITATYNGPWYDLGNWDMRRMLWMDLLTDSTVGAFSFDVDIAWDWGRSGYTETHTVTDTAMDGSALFWTGSYANFVRVFTEGVGQSFQPTYTVTSSANPPRIIGWRLEGRQKGARAS